MKVAIYTRKDKTEVYEMPQYLWDVYCLYQSTFGRKLWLIENKYLDPKENI